MLNTEERLRYVRQITLPDMGLEGQIKLKQTRILCVGAGGVGCPALLYLAAAGIGVIGIVDNDIIALENLQRQILYKKKYIGFHKAQIASDSLREINENINLIIYKERMVIDNVEKIISGYDIVLDGSDNFSTRYLVNDVCFFLGVPVVSASVYEYAGQLLILNYESGPCYRCVYPEPLPLEFFSNCNDNGILGTVSGVLGTLAANEVIKLALGKKVETKLLVFDALLTELKKFNVAKNKECFLCGENVICKKGNP